MPTSGGQDNPFLTGGYNSDIAAGVVAGIFVPVLAALVLYPVAKNIPSLAALMFRYPLWLGFPPLGIAYLIPLLNKSRYPTFAKGMFITLHVGMVLSCFSPFFLLAMMFYNLGKSS